MKLEAANSHEIAVPLMPLHPPHTHTLQPLGKSGLSVLPLMLPRTGRVWELEGLVVTGDSPAPHLGVSSQMWSPCHLPTSPPKIHTTPAWLMSLRLPWPRHPLLPLPKVMMIPRSGKRGREERDRGEIRLFFQRDQSNLGLEKQ